MNAPKAARCSNLAPYARQAHSLWINLWMSLGHRAENQRQSGGNAPTRGLADSVPTAWLRFAPRLVTAPVHDHSGGHLAGLQLSPGSTVPTTTTRLVM